MAMEFAAALSEHPLATQATGEVVGQILETMDTPPDIAMLFVTAPHAGASPSPRTRRTHNRRA